MLEPGESQMNGPILSIKMLGKDYTVKGKGGIILQNKEKLIAVDHITLEIEKGTTLGLVGESGCGKSTLGRMLCRLEAPSRGEIYFQGQPIHALKGESLRRIRHFFQPVFQDPLGSLNPRLNVFQTLAEPLQLYGKKGDENEVIILLETVGLGNEVMHRYAHQLSGGQRQRLGIARALAVGPQLLVADEPVSSLDVSIQAQVLNLFLSLQQKLQLTMVFISHDLRVISQLADRVAVMYVGRIMEMASTRELFDNPCHPYTQALLNALPRLEPGRGRKRAILTGEIPSPVNPVPGCRFYSRCQYREEGCRYYENEIIKISPEHNIACKHWQKVREHRKNN